MNRIALSTFALILATGATGSMVPVAAAPQALRVHGYLVDQAAGTNGLPADGPVAMTFALYDVATGGAPLALVGPLVVDVVNGRYDARVPFTDDLFDGTPRYVEVTVENETLLPRFELASVPFAYDAETVGGYSAAELDDSAEIDSKITIHAAMETAQTDAKIAAHAAEESAQIDAEFAAHAADPDAHPTYVKRAGDTMTGALTVNPVVGPGMRLKGTPGGGIEFLLPTGTASTRLGWDSLRQTLAFDGNVGFDEGKRLEWPTVSGPYAGGPTFSISKLAGSPPGQDLHPDGEQDETFQFCYNCDGPYTQRDDARQHAWNQTFESNYFDGLAEYMEVNWNYESVDGFRTRPFGFIQQMTPTCVDPSGLLDAQPCLTSEQRTACESIGGLCLLDDSGTFAWNPSPYGLCGEDPDQLCKSGFGGASVGCASSCDRPFDLRINRRGGVVQSGTGLEITTEQPGPLRFLRPSTYYAPLHSIQVISPREPGLSFSAVHARQTFADGAASGVGIVDWLGADLFQQFSGATVADRVVGRWIAMNAVQYVDQAAPGAAVEQTVGYRWQLRPQGQEIALGDVAGVEIATPSVVSGGLGTQSLARLRGLHVGDLLGLGEETDAVLVDPQSGSDGAKGNLRLAGGGALDGHLALGSGSLWWDAASSTFRVKEGDPSDDADGTPLHAPPGMGPGWGEVLWGAAGGGMSSAEAVCQAAGLSCARGFDPVAGTDVACADSTWQGAYFMAFCN